MASFIMRLNCRVLIILVAMLLIHSSATAGERTNSLDGWQQGVSVSPVLGEAAGHSIHSYFNTYPESPDGRLVLFYRSTTAEGHHGQVCVQERSTGSVRVLADQVEVEDAHRAACQQWVRDGAEVVFHDLRQGRWSIVAVNLSDGKQRVLAQDRQLCWGRPDGEVVPLYGPHWSPGEHRDLELLNVRTGRIKTVLTAAEARKAALASSHADYFRTEFGERPLSIFFPILSPDGNRIFFKLATPSGGGFRHPRGSHRQGLLCYDLKKEMVISVMSRWGHPAWHSDSRHILNILDRKLILIDSETGEFTTHEKLPPFPGSHPSLSNNSRLFVTDTRLGSVQGAGQYWGVVVGEWKSGQHELIHRFDNSQGAKSWRPSHPHPVFNAQGTRIYFNVSQDRWTRLYVAETGGQD